MNQFSRLGTLILLASGVLGAPLMHAGRLAVSPAGVLLLPGAPQGYLGVGIMDVDSDRAAALKLKEARGAEIITVDQDAPAAKAGLKVHDVVVQMNGQRVEGIEQFRRMLRETPPGRTVSLVAMRNGQAVNLSAQLGDRATIAKASITGLGDLPAGHADESAVATQPAAPSSGKRSYGHVSTFLPSFSRSQPYVGVAVQPLTTQLAEFFGVHNGSGLLIGSVFPNSPGAAAGLKAADIIQKINGQPIVTPSDWERAIRANRGKQVQVTIVREKKEQTVSMVAGEAKNSSAVKDAGRGRPDAMFLAELRNDSKD